MKSKKTTVTATWGQVEVTPGAILYHQMVVRESFKIIIWLLLTIIVLITIGLFV